MQNDWKLVNGDYYGFYIKKPSSGNVQFYGTSTQTFLNGNLYSNSAGSLTALDKSLAFMSCTFSDSKGMSNPSGLIIEL